MSSIAPVRAAFGYTNYVLAHDSTLNKAPKPTAPVATPPFASTAPSTGPSPFGSPAPDARAVAIEGTAFFAKAGMAALVRTWSPAAVAYMARQTAATAGPRVVDAHA